MSRLASPLLRPLPCRGRASSALFDREGITGFTPQAFLPVFRGRSFSSDIEASEEKGFSP